MAKKLKNLIPKRMYRMMQKLRLVKRQLPFRGKIDFGDFLRTKPLSADFGFERGGPIDRYYIERFLQHHASAIKGRVLEIGDNVYTRQFGGDKVIISDILHVHAQNPKATIIGNLEDAPNIADNSFDCIILTQTLHLIYDFKAALRTCERILKPGGTMLMTVPGITPIDQGEWNHIWLWSFNNRSISLLMEETFTDSTFEIQSFGNVFSAASFLYGLGLSEVKKEMLDVHDPQYQVVVTVNATKNESH